LCEGRDAVGTRVGWLLATLVTMIIELFNLVKSLITESSRLAFAFASSVDVVLTDTWCRGGDERSGHGQTYSVILWLSRG
jgi:hypothetical protein